MDVFGSAPSILMLLAGVAAAGSVMLLFKSRGGLPGCGADSPCVQVFKSRWSRWGAIPIAAPGAAVYSAIFFLAWMARHSGQLWASGSNGAALLALTLIAGGAAIWFMALQTLAIGRLCIYCAAIHVAALAMAGLMLHAASVAHLPGKFWALGSAAGALFALVVGQVLLEPKLYALTTPPISPRPPQRPQIPHKDELAGSPAAASETRAAVATEAAPAGRQIVAFDGRAVLKMPDWPVLGSPGAAHVLVHLYDYTCEDCRHVHQLIQAALARYRERLAILCVPFPLERPCNPTVQYVDERHANACQYARLALAVWNRQAEKFAEFHRWLFELERPQPIGEALRKAQQLLQIDTIDAVLRGPSIEDRLKDAIRVFQSIGGGNIPKLLFPKACLWGRVPSADYLFEVIEQQLRITVAASPPSAATSPPTSTWGPDQASWLGAAQPPGQDTRG